MAELELTEEERALLAAAEAPENPIVSEPVAIVDDGEIVQPPPVETPKARRGRPPRREEPLAEPVVATEPLDGPEPGNPTAPPAQYDYGDPWGRLPAQMRHHVDGTPAF